MIPSDVCPPTAALVPAVSTDHVVLSQNAQAPDLQRPSRQYHSWFSFPARQSFYRSTDPSLYSLAQPISTALMSHTSTLLSSSCGGLSQPFASLVPVEPQATLSVPSQQVTSMPLHLGRYVVSPLSDNDNLWLQALQQDRTIMIGKLIDVSADIIESIWSPHFLTHHQHNPKVVSTKAFIQEILQRSRATYATLQISLFYLFRVKRIVHALLRDHQMGWQKSCPPHSVAAIPPSPPSSQSSDPEDECNFDRSGHSQGSNDHPTSFTGGSDDLMCCGRRMFLASLIVASKYLHDKSYRNHAWAKISGLAIAEVNACELAFLRMMDYKLFVSKPTFDKWCIMLHTFMQKHRESDHNMGKRKRE